MAEWISERFPWRILTDEEFWVRVLARRITTKKPCEEGLLFDRARLGFKLPLKHALIKGEAAGFWPILLESFKKL